MGTLLNYEINSVLTMLSQFAFIHRDTNLLCFAMVRKPARNAFSVAEFAPLERATALKVLVASMVIVAVLVAM